MLADVSSLEVEIYTEDVGSTDDDKSDEPVSMSIDEDSNRKLDGVAEVMKLDEDDIVCSTEVCM